MDDNKLWLYFWIAAAVVVLSITCAVALVKWQADVQITAMVRTGVDPIKASCAINPSRDAGLVILCKEAK